MRLSCLLLIAALVHGQESTPAEDPSSAALYRKALAYQKKGIWRRARNTFRKLIKKFPNSPHVQDALHRSGDNAYLGCTPIWESGPADNRIDLSVMGDGFTIDGSDQKLQERWAKLCIDVLWHEKSYSEYRNYCNIYFVRLASLEEGVDPNLTPEELQKARERNRRRRRALNYKIDYSTALNCKAAGPQGQVMADRGLVYKWLGIADKDVPGCGQDRFVIAFARFGRLGMGGGGIANVGRPDKSVTVHEFGHAFSRLLDEYAVNPNPPQGMFGRGIRAANAFASMKEPKPSEVPWAHMLRKRVKGVGIYEGGATFKKGVWKPARTCAMNIGGNQFCPVCREQTILVIYEYINPIDDMAPRPVRELKVVEGDETKIYVTPMRPLKHRLEVAWFVAAHEEEEDAAAADSPENFDPFAELRKGNFPGQRRRNMFFSGSRAREDRTQYHEPPVGKRSKLGKEKRGRAKRSRVHVFPVGKLPPGRWRITVQVKDTTKWVLKDPEHLLEERATWTATVSRKPAGK